jgi:carbonic anhydrase
MESGRRFALQTMMGGNKRFTQGQLTYLNDDLKMLKEHTAEPKAPFAAVLRCADSRAHVELVFDQTIGHLFVCRVRRQYRNRRSDRQLKHGVAVFGTTAIMVPGHGNCGAVDATIKAKAVPRPDQRALSSPASCAQLTIDTAPLARL